MLRSKPTDTSKNDLFKAPTGHDLLPGKIKAVRRPDEVFPVRKSVYGKENRMKLNTVEKPHRLTLCARKLRKILTVRSNINGYGKTGNHSSETNHPISYGTRYPNQTIILSGQDGEKIRKYSYPNNVQHRSSSYGLYYINFHRSGVRRRLRFPHCRNNAREIYNIVIRIPFLNQL